MFYVTLLARSRQLLKKAIALVHRCNRAYLERLSAQFNDLSIAAHLLYIISERAEVFLSNLMWEQFLREVLEEERQSKNENTDEPKS